MHAKPPVADANEHFVIHGQVGASSFAPWITRHAARLGVSGRILGQSQTRLDLALTGPPDLLDAMAVGCSLGPQEVWVDQIVRLPVNALSCDEFSSPAA
ncbi:MAG: acylphosphatase [Candidatus Saccharibacteria bacterium]|nr:acylphosphatase [Pseudorhodobacter sp.]